jgi:hypothetical protein
LTSPKANTPSSPRAAGGRPRIRIFHPCAPRYDNLGEIVANGAIAPMFARRGADIELRVDDLWARRAAGVFLDERIETLNAEFDLLMIGPAGFLGPKMTASIFRDLQSWDRLKIPLCFNGVGVVASIGKPVWYSTMDASDHGVRALARASTVSVRDTNSWLLAARALAGDTARLTLAGCPSVRFVRCEHPPAKSHELALNLSFFHENCRRHVPALLRIAEAVRARRRRVLWICHSRVDELQARGVNARLALGFDVVRPLDAAAAGKAYASCEHALVTRFHAGVFCLANAVPFGFVGYDVKCWHLLAMLADEPHQYVLAIDRVTEAGADGEVERLLQRLDAAAEPLARAAVSLAAFFDAQTDRFVDATLAAVAGSASARPASEIAAGEDAPREAAGR